MLKQHVKVEKCFPNDAILLFDLNNFNTMTVRYGKDKVEIFIDK